MYFRISSAWRQLVPYVPIAAATHLLLHDKLVTACQAKPCKFSAETYPANNPTEDRNFFNNMGDWNAAAVFDGRI
jgi:hypothetical protein